MSSAKCRNESRITWKIFRLYAGLCHCLLGYGSWVLSVYVWQFIDGSQVISNSTCFTCYLFIWASYGDMKPCRSFNNSNPICQQVEKGSISLRHSYVNHILRHQFIKLRCSLSVHYEKQSLFIDRFSGKSNANQKVAWSLSSHHKFNYLKCLDNAFPTG